MSRNNLMLMPSDGDDADITIPDADEAAWLQAQEASDALSAKASDFFTMPWAPLAKMVGGIPKGDVWYAGGFSGDGKTAFFTSLAGELTDSGKRVYYVPTESPAKVIRTHFACKRLGYDAGDLLSGKYLEWINAKDVRAEVRAEVKRLAMPDESGKRRLWIGADGFISSLRLLAEGAHAAQLGADVFIVDHIDHVEGSGRSMYESSVQANGTLLKIAQDYGLVVFAATQFNLEAVRGNRIMRYLAPQPNYVYMGNHKRHIASGMLGLYRCLKLTGLDPDLLKAFNQGSSTVQAKDILEPSTMAISLMKHRLYGNREGQKVMLHVQNGRVMEMPTTEQGYQHGIRTSRDVA